MTTAAGVIAVARHYRGIQESPRGSNHQMFGAWYGMNDVAWCAEFTSYCQYVAGHRWSGATTSKGFAYVPSIVDWGRSTGRISRTPHLADLACWYNSREGEYGHVELVSGWNDSYFSSVGGNTGDANLSNGGEVIEHSHPRSGWVFVSPRYNNTAARSLSVPKSVSPVRRNIGLTSPYTNGADVKWVQQRLVALRLLNEAPDGYYGPHTRNAVLHFQTLRRLVKDGVCGPITGYHLAIGH